MITPRPVALVTGASVGIGRAIAARLAADGYRTFGTARSPVHVNAPSGVELMALDVCSDDSVAACVSAVSEKAGRIDLLVNNAGVTLEGALEETSLAEARAVFETNFFGVLRVTKEVLPTFREQRSGRVVTIGSVAGFLPKPFEGIYAATKHAVAAWSETLDHEVRTFGVRAVLVEPGFIRTDLNRNTARAEQVMSAYAAARRTAAAVMQADIATGDAPEVIAAKVAQVAGASCPRTRYLAGRGAWRIRMLRKWLPAWAFDRGVRRRFYLDHA